MTTQSIQQDALKIYFVVGEESGDALGSRLLKTFKERDIPINALGLAGSRMQKQGMVSLFEISDISVMGVSGVVAQLPKLLSRIRKTADDILARQPHVVILIDSPEFSYRVAQKVRKKAPHIKIIKYVSPSIWAWRPGRAKKIAPYIDHILAVLPFEPELLKELGGPSATYVGHPLASEMPEMGEKPAADLDKPFKLLVLPGSRKSETKRLLPIIEKTLITLKERGNQFEVTLPAVDRLKDEIEQVTRQWNVPVKIITGDDARKQAFENSDLALAASGTVTLELALYKVPMISIYKLDFMAMQIRHMLTGWTASLPNLIADYPFIPERFNEYSHPQYVARMIERLVVDGHERKIQMDGFDLVRQRMAQDAPGEMIATDKILEIAEWGEN